MKIRIATYNLFEGAQGSYNRLVDFVRTNDIDVLCLQEINGWQEADAARMRDFTDRGLFVQYAYGNSNTPYKLATFSKQSFTKSDAYIEGFWHCVVETRIALPSGQQLAILNVHLDPWQEASRVRELDRLVRTIDPSIPTIITGDFNSLSRKDGYGPELLAELQRRGIAKFGRSDLEFDVTDYLEQAGYVDIAARLNQMEVTVPTASAQDKDHDVPVRVDYVFATPNVAGYAQKVEVAKTDLTNSISDHYPVIVTFEFDDTSASASTQASQQAEPATPVQPQSATSSEPKKDDTDETVVIIPH